MRIFMHEFGGYAFIAELARGLARRGHEVVFAFSASVQTPQGALTRRADDPAGLTFEPVRLADPISKYSFRKRFVQERAHARLVLELIARHEPDVVFSSDAPSQVQWMLARACRKSEIYFVNWVQDLYGLAAYRLLRKKVPVIGAMVGRYFQWLDRRVNRISDAVIVIAEAFRNIVIAEGAREETISVQPNWAALDELPVMPTNNRWAVENGLADKFCFIYSGTLAMKHNPALLLALGRRFRDQPEVRIVVVSEGKSVEGLVQSAKEEGLSNVVSLPFQPIERLPEVLGTAGVLVAVLEPDAGVFSVPSKILTYLCAARPLLLSIPPDNLAAATVVQADAGRIAAPGDEAAFLSAAGELFNSADLRQTLGGNGRAYAEASFDLAHIAARFESLAKDANQTKPRPTFTSVVEPA